VLEVGRVRAAVASRYRVDRLLGAGGMATVYLAEDLRHHRLVALKVMRAELAATVGADRFLREIEIASQLSHPHILPVYDSGEADGVLYYVMPYVEGESLRELVQRGGQLPVDEAVRLGREVAEALAFAHTRNIIHRDIKPANILLSAGHALVADFGIARAMGAEGGLTQTGLAVGTPQYMSPEQASGAPQVDARADVYAVGIMLYEMLAGEPPFTGPTAQAILARSLTEEVRPLGEKRRDLPGSVIAVVTKALARNPDERQQTAAELAQALGTAENAVRSGAVSQVAAGPSPWRTAGLFGLAVAGVLTVVFVVLRQLGLPSWVFALAVGLAAAGVPILLLTGRTEQRRLAGREVRGIRRWMTWKNAMAGGVLALLLWASVATLLAVRGTGGGGSDGLKRLAVLPFENLGPSDNAYFADGVTDAVRGKLTALAGFQVTARSSSAQYQGTSKSPQVIGKELGVEYLLSATVRWANGAGGANRVQVVPELIDARTGAATWQQTFDADLTDVFKVQQEIAAQVAGALGVVMGTGERNELAARPTENLAAYDAYLRGEAIFLALARPDPASLRRAASYYEQAVAMDSTFGQAWAQLARVRSNLYAASVPTPVEAEGARRAVERARALAPRAPETFLAGSLFAQNVLRDQEQARQLATQGLAAAPSNIELMIRVAGLEAQDQPEEAVRVQQRATELDPRAVPSWAALAGTLLGLHRPTEAAVAVQRGLEVDPGNFRLWQLRIICHLQQGDLAGARNALAQVPRDVDQAALVGYLATYQDLFWVLTDTQQSLLLQLPPSAFDNDRATWAAVMMQTYWDRGDKARARAYADTAQAAYVPQIGDAPEDPQLHVLYGVALAYGGRADEAIREGQRGLDLSGPGRPNSVYFHHQLARSYVLVGQPDRAMDQLEPLLSQQYLLTPAWLRIDPAFASLKGNPRFERLTSGRPTG
jgi:serine/threonine-protein kinase